MKLIKNILNNKFKQSKYKVIVSLILFLILNVTVYFFNISLNTIIHICDIYVIIYH